MKSALQKLLIGLAVAIGLFVVLLVPNLRGDRTTDLAIQSPPELAETSSRPAAAPTEIVLPTATAEPAPPATTAPLSATPLPAADIVVVLPTVAPTLVPTVEPTAVATAIPPTPTAVPTVEAVVISTVVPTVAPTLEPTAEPTAQPTAEPTVTPTVEPTAEPTVEPTAVPTAEPTAVPTAEPTATATPAPTVEAVSSINIDAGWMYVTSTDGLFLRDVPGGQITNVLTYRSEVYLNGLVESSGDHLWVLVELPEPGWLALSFLSVDEPAPPASTGGGDGRPTEPPTTADWEAFRDCESGGRYTVVDPSGLYHGAYQFLPSTWDGLARQFWPELAGVLPSQASPADQDKMALKLFELEGTRPWPTCGRHLL